MMTFDQIMEEMEELSRVESRSEEQEARLIWLAKQLVLVTAA